MIFQNILNMIIAFIMSIAPNFAIPFFPPPTHAPAPIVNAAPTPAINEAAVVEQIFNQINYERTSRGLPYAAWNDNLGWQSREWSIIMRDNGGMWHSPTALDYADTDNVARVYYDPAKTVGLWMNSDSHRENLLSPYVTSIGIGVAYDPGTDCYFITQRGLY